MRATCDCSMVRSNLDTITKNHWPTHRQNRKKNSSPRIKLTPGTLESQKVAPEFTPASPAHGLAAHCVARLKSPAARNTTDPLILPPAKELLAATVPQPNGITPPRVIARECDNGATKRWASGPLHGWPVLSLPTSPKLRAFFFWRKWVFWKVGKMSSRALFSHSLW